MSDLATAARNINGAHVCVAKIAAKPANGITTG